MIFTHLAVKFNDAIYPQLFEVAQISGFVLILEEINDFQNFAESVLTINEYRTVFPTGTLAGKETTRRFAVVAEFGDGFLVAKQGHRLHLAENRLIQIVLEDDIAIDIKSVHKNPDFVSVTNHCPNQQKQGSTTRQAMLPFSCSNYMLVRVYFSSI